MADVNLDEAADVLRTAVHNARDARIAAAPLCQIGPAVAEQFAAMSDMAMAMLTHAGFVDAMPRILWCAKRGRDADMPPSRFHDALNGVVHATDIPQLQIALSDVCNDARPEVCAEAIRVAKQKAISILR